MPKGRAETLPHRKLIKQVALYQALAIGLSPFLPLTAVAQGVAPTTAPADTHINLPSAPTASTILPTDVLPLTGAQERIPAAENFQLRLNQYLPSRFYFSASVESSFRLETNPFQFPQKRDLLRQLPPPPVFRQLNFLQQRQIINILKEVNSQDMVFRVLPNVSAGWTVTPRTRVYGNFFTIRDSLFKNIRLNTDIYSYAWGMQHDFPLGTRTNLQVDFQARELNQMHQKSVFDFLPGLTLSYILNPKTVLFANSLIQIRGRKYFQAPTREFDPFYTVGGLYNRGGWTFSASSTFVQNFRNQFGNHAQIPVNNYVMISDFEIARRLFKQLPGIQAFVRAEPIWNMHSHNRPGLAGTDFRLFWGLRAAMAKPALTSTINNIMEQLRQQEDETPGNKTGPKPSAYLPAQVIAGLQQPIHGYLSEDSQDVLSAAQTASALNVHLPTSPVIAELAEQSAPHVELKPIPMIAQAPVTKPATLSDVNWMPLAEKAIASSGPFISHAAVTGAALLKAADSTTDAYKRTADRSALIAKHVVPAPIVGATPCVARATAVPQVLPEPVHVTDVKWDDFGALASHAVPDIHSNNLDAVVETASAASTNDTKSTSTRIASFVRHVDCVIASAPPPAKAVSLIDAKWDGLAGVASHSVQPFIANNLNHALEIASANSTSETKSTETRIASFVHKAVGATPGVARASAVRTVPPQAPLLTDAKWDNLAAFASDSVQPFIANNLNLAVELASANSTNDTKLTETRIASFVHKAVGATPCVARASAVRTVPPPAPLLTDTKWDNLAAFASDSVQPIVANNLNLAVELASANSTNDTNDTKLTETRIASFVHKAVGATPCVARAAAVRTVPPPAPLLTDAKWDNLAAFASDSVPEIATYQSINVAAEQACAATTQESKLTDTRLASFVHHISPAAVVATIKPTEPTGANIKKTAPVIANGIGTSADQSMKQALLSCSPVPVVQPKLMTYEVADADWSELANLSIKGLRLSSAYLGSLRSLIDAAASESASHINYAVLKQARRTQIARAPIATPPQATLWVPMRGDVNSEFKRDANTSVSERATSNERSSLAGDRPAAKVSLPFAVERVDNTVATTKQPREEQIQGTTARLTKNVNMRIVPPLPTVKMSNKDNPFSGTGIDLKKPFMLSLPR